ncbi:hypothetical protein CC2G_001486 [Coprinopsis cinerea AmutBmut pab1-1]|nr:hypothetical protein CC2G_001486 [Coprinopsis cinerea AmutBmut pab1-1]
MAEEWNENGSQAYREGNLARAKEFYQKAARIGSKHASTEPKYFSNLSAVLFELGEYEECMKAITKSWTILKHGGTSLESSPLAIKLATRYAKSYYYAREPSRVKVHEDIKKFAKGVSGNDQDEKAKEISFWWKFIESGAREYSPTEDELDRARRTSIFKTRQLPTKELYHFGHDAVRSLLDGLEHDPSTEMKQSDLDPSEKKRLAFLFGGSGDARHVFGTVLHAANSGWNNKWHMTLIEIHPATVARNVLVFELFSEIQGARTEEEKDELFASLVYLYTSMAIPDYCVQRLMKTSAAAAERLSTSAQGEGPVILHGHLSIDRSSVPEILVVLKQWCQPIEKSVATMMKYNPVIKEPVGEKLSERLEQFDAMFRGQVGFDPNEDTKLERRLIDETRALIPPATLIKRHPALLKLHTTRKLAGPTLKAVREEVLKTWKPNFALFQNVTTYGQRLGLFDEGYPENDQNPQDNLSSFFYMCIRFSKHHQMMELMSVPRTVFYVFKQFFIRVIAALRALRGRLVVEIAVDDVITGLPRIFADSARPKTYPNKFTRMWLSNVPCVISRYVERRSGQEQDDKVKEMGTWWEMIKDGEREASPTEELDRARNTGIHKTSLVSAMELYPMGHDPVHSLIDGVDQDPSTEMKEKDRDSVEKKRLAFLFGGSGDGRHVFTTLIHAASLKWSNKWHMTLVDIHPITVAKTIVIYELLAAVGQAKNEEERDEIYATLAFMYTWAFLPDYCVQRLMKTCEALYETLSSSGGLGPVLLHGHLSIPRSSLPGVIAVLEEWRTPLKKSAARMMELNPTIPPPTGNELDDETKRIDAMVRNATGVDVNEDNEFEQRLIDKTRALIPPATLITRHPALKRVLEIRKLTGQALRDVKTEVMQKWQPNFLIFDREDIEKHFLYACVRSLPPESSINVMRVPRTVFQIMKQFFTLVVAALNALKGRVVVEVVLEDVIAGLPRLFADPARPKTYPQKFTRMWLSNVPDYTGGTLNTTVFLIPHLHRSKSSMIMSNMLLNTVLFSQVPEVTYNYTLLEEKNLQRFLACRNVKPLDENSAWGRQALIADTDVVRKASRLPSKDELNTWLSHLLLTIVKPAYTNVMPCRIDQPNNLAAFVHVLIYLNTVVGVPGHWLAEFLALVLDNRLATTAKPYCGFLPVPIDHEQDKRTKPERVNLEFWRSDLRLVLSDLKPLIQFPIRHILPDNFFLRKDDIVHLKTRITENQGVFMPFPHTPFVSAIAFAFYKLQNNANIESVVKESSLTKVFEMSPDQVKKTIGSVQIMLSNGRVDVVQEEYYSWLQRGKRLVPPSFVSWRMAREDYERMCREKWEMVLYRTDNGITATCPIKASDWVVVEA